MKNKETIEEAADNSLQDEINYWYEKTGSLTSEDIVRRAYSLGITEGAKWQAERMYSEEEVYHILCEHTAFLFAGGKSTLSEWFEQFKK